MAFPSWDNFLEAKEKKETGPANMGYGGKPKDYYVGDMNTPPQGYGKNPYFAPNAKNDGKPLVRVAEKPTDALGDKSSPPFSDPKAVQPYGEKPDYKAMKVENDQSRMTTSEFIEAMLQERASKKKDDVKSKKDFTPSLTCQFSGKKAIPAYYEVARYMANMLPVNENARTALIRELKSVDGGLPALIEELMRHGEVYSTLVRHMSDEPKTSRRLAKAMNDHYHEWLDEAGLRHNPLKEGVDLPVEKRRKVDDDDQDAISHNANMGKMAAVAGMSGSDPGTEDDDPLNHPFPSDEDPSKGMDDPANAGLSGDSGMIGINSPGMDSGMPDIPQSGDISGADSNPANAMGDENYEGGESMPFPEAKLNKLFSHHHLIGEMAKYGHMASVMRETLGG